MPPAFFFFFLACEKTGSDVKVDIAGRGMGEEPGMALVMMVEDIRHWCPASAVVQGRRNWSSLMRC